MPLIDHFRSNIEPESLAPLRQRLEDHKERVAAGAQALDEQLALARTALVAGRERVPQWELPSELGHEDAGWSLIGPGLRKTYKRGRRGMQEAYSEPSVAAFHEWRKRAKYLRYQLRLVRRGWPRVLKATHKEVKGLGDLLGDDHDLAVLEQIIEEAEAEPGQADSEQILLALAAQRSEQLRDAAYGLGSRCTPRSRSIVDRRLQRYWQAARGGVERHA